MENPSVNDKVSVNLKLQLEAQRGN